METDLAGRRFWFGAVQCSPKCEKEPGDMLPVASISDLSSCKNRGQKTINKLITDNRIYMNRHFFCHVCCPAPPPSRPHTAPSMLMILCFVFCKFRRATDCTDQIHTSTRTTE
jgi:hypothetical protein